MTGLFIDTSVLVAIIADEPDRASLATNVEDIPRRFTSSVALLEAAMVISSRLELAPTRAGEMIEDFIRDQEISVLPIDHKIVPIAIHAFELYGKGRHRARLNFGDCISYACARAHGLTLLYKGDDFAHTDLGDQGSRA